MATMFYLGTILIPICINNAIGAISSAKQLYDITNNANNYFHMSEKDCSRLNKLDIYSTIEPLKKKIKEIDRQKCSKSLKISVERMEECIISIENEVINIQEILCRNGEKKYFNSIRKEKITENVNRLEAFMGVLKQRTEMFFALISLEKKNIYNKNIEESIYDI